MCSLSGAPQHDGVGGGAERDLHEKGLFSRTIIYGHTWKDLCSVLHITLLHRLICIAAHAECFGKRIADRDAVDVMHIPRRLQSTETISEPRPPLDLVIGEMNTTPIRIV